MEVTSSDLRCYIRHVRQAKVCARGSRAWCEAHNIDWSSFLADGIPAQRLTDTGDPIVARVVAAAEQEAANGRQE